MLITYHNYQFNGKQLKIVNTRYTFILNNKLKKNNKDQIAEKIRAII